ncbi:endonuclease/exonuclease/phosphatase family protein [Holdemania massiliensis]|uniref:endonuclease/exonuclease/phosphatase family protein n=2 Tax=Holdemania massiliensis TaxID=1468449 RepID=UPI001F0694DA|nr:endonuclease/exonuclease/phosphatase family protein [Holdemania massiliensis]MCH1941385.1 endonuclease/exonuclease/phosphatase family protein [Holdemania massiliensis]
MTCIKVMTFNLKNDLFFTRKNLRWDTRRQYVRNLIASTSPDIIGVQELSDLMREQLQALLPQYQFVGQARNRRRQFMNEHSDILFLKDRFDLLGEKTFWLSKQPDQAGSRTWTSIFPRICTMVHLKDRETEQVFRVFNTHLDHLLSYTRTFEVRTIISEMQRLQKEATCPLILMGDLNSTLSSPALQLLTMPENRLHLKPVYDSSAMFNTLHYGKGRLKEDRQPIDYIYVSEEFDVHSTRIITTCFNGLYPSDHYPVICHLVKKGNTES